MNGTVEKLVFLLAIAAIVACSAGGISNPPAAVALVRQWQAKHLARRVCPAAPRGRAQCEVLVENTLGYRTSGLGWTPADFQKRYNLPSSSKGAGQIVAIVDAYDNPNVASDLAEYRQQFDLGTASFYKYNQEGQQSNYPEGSPQWGVEIDLDVQMVSAVCPKCTIYLIEANSTGGSDMETAEAQAVTLGAHIISNSWICYGTSCGIENSYFDTPGVVYLAASGDDAYGDNGPPMWFGNVVAVGGTYMEQEGTSYNEIVWDDAGSGCSTGIPKPKWQHDGGCSSRTDDDISAVAYDAGIYDSFSQGGWIRVAGTSIATPIIAGVYALAGNARSVHADKKLWSLNRKQAFKMLHDVDSGNNGSCGGSYLCTAGTNQYKTYSGPAGWGTPNGIGAF